MSDAVRPADGDVWKEIDPRAPRFVEILKVGKTTCFIRKVTQSPAGIWSYAPRSRWTEANLLRFNGKRGGYSLHRRAADVVRR